MPYTPGALEILELLPNMPPSGPPVRRLRAAQPSSTTASDPKASSGTRPGAQASAQSNRPAKPRFTLPTGVTIRIAIPLLLGLIAQIAILVAFGQRDLMSFGAVLLAGLAGILIALLVLLVVLVDMVTFDISILVGGFEFRVGSFECMTIPVLTVILRLFWRAATWKCLLVSSIAVFALATAFRYGFIIPLPGTD